MERYLLFDANCGKCRRIAGSIAPETEGWLTVRSLHDEDMQELLTQARPNWTWQPTLLEVREEASHASTGVVMILRFVLGLGPLRTLRILIHLKRNNALKAIIVSGL